MNLVLVWQDRTLSVAYTVKDVVCCVPELRLAQGSQTQIAPWATWGLTR